jgi:hypothetical protein
VLSKAHALNNTVCTFSDSTKLSATDSVLPSKNLVTRLLEYLDDTNKPKPMKKYDFSFLGGPYYSSDTKLGVGLVAAGTYRRDLTDSITPPAQMSLYGDVSITGYYKIGLRGLSHFNAMQRRLVYNVSFESNPDRYWGIGYTMASNHDNRIDIKRLHTQLDATYYVSVLNPALYIGPRLTLDHVMGRKMEDYVETYIHGQSTSTFSSSVGLSVIFDTRDNAFNAYRGIYLRLDQMVAPKFIANKYAFSATELTLSSFNRLWSSAVLASQFHARFTYGDTPWGLMSRLGGSYTMRGYWEGRYNDKCAADVTVELRQHIHGRHGMVIWVGMGSVFAKPKDITDCHLLPNFGVGYRWEFKKRVNVRVDYGVGRHESGIIFSINEAF